MATRGCVRDYKLWYSSRTNWLLVVTPAQAAELLRFNRQPARNAHMTP
jgi:hypothetical protein